MKQQILATPNRRRMAYLLVLNEDEVKDEGEAKDEAKAEEEDEETGAADGAVTATGRSRRTKHVTTAEKGHIKQDCPVRKRAAEARNQDTMNKRRKGVGNAAIATVGSIEDEGGH